MNPLDENLNSTINPDDVSIWPTVQKWAGILTLLSIIFMVLSFLTIGNGMVSGLLSLASLVATVWVFYSAFKYFRDEELGGYITLKKCLSIGVPIAIISTTIGTLFQYFYVTYVDASIIDQSIQMALNMIESFGQTPTDEMVDEIEKSTRAGFTFPRMALSGILGGSIMGLIISAIMGAIMKKERPMV